LPSGSNLVNEELQQFRKDPKVKTWESSLHPKTKSGYTSNLYHIVRVGLGLTGSEFLRVAEQNPKETSIKVKANVKSLNGQLSNNTLLKRVASMQNFLDFFEVERLPLSGLRIKTIRAVPRPLLSWHEAERIIKLADAAYQPVYRFMLWGLDAERFVQLNTDKQALQEVKELLENPTNDFIEIPIHRRKEQGGPYYILTPRELAENLPVRKIAATPIDNVWTIQFNWRVALKRAGYPTNKKYGAHNLRSYWKTEALKRGLPEELRQFQLGHTVDEMNYQRIFQDKKWVLEQFRKAWEIKPVATKEELEQRDKKIAELEGVKGVTLQLLQEDIQELDEQIKTRESVTGEAAKLLVKPELEALRAKRDTRQKQLAALQGTTSETP